MEARPPSQYLLRKLVTLSAHGSSTKSASSSLALILFSLDLYFRPKTQSYLSLFLCASETITPRFLSSPPLAHTVPSLLCALNTGRFSTCPRFFYQKEYVVQLGDCKMGTLWYLWMKASAILAIPPILPFIMGGWWFNYQPPSH